ncbi:FkbM family methyltransferase [Gammaproteobacteria bacterium]|nr:FkbM family methyltransferase [Gammaproteobacteria bacterium]MDA9258783.1 FkbM family methyltransferase [Gammaproteobacteria bacterium]
MKSFFRSKLSRVMIGVRGLTIFRNRTIRRYAKKVLTCFCYILYGKFKVINIASKYPVKLKSNFAFSGWEQWGENHNSGFHKLIELSRDKKTILDVGSHIGLCSIPISLYCNVEKIFAFEPNEINREILAQHIHANNILNIEVIPNLIGKNHGEFVELFSPDEVSGIPSIANLQQMRKDNKKYHTSSHLQISIDEFCKSNQIKPDVIKIDVEGAEFGVLEGAIDIIKQFKPYILISLHPKHLINLGKDVNEIFKICQSLNYRLLTCGEEEQTEVSIIGLDEYLMEPIFNE